MVLTAHQACYLPWLGLFHKIALADKFILWDDVQYQPKDFNNRNKIKFPDGPKWLTVPVLRKGYLDKKCWEIEIDNRSNWRQKHWKSIVQCYRKAPYFDDYYESLKFLYAYNWTHLWELNQTLMTMFCGQLGISHTNNEPCQWQRLSDLNCEGTKSELVLNVCKKVGATKYIFGSQGRDYADVEAFEREGIEVIFQDYQHPYYAQRFGKFEPYMAVIDLLFNEGPNSLEILMNGNVRSV